MFFLEKGGQINQETLYIDFKLKFGTVISHSMYFGRVIFLTEFRNFTFWGLSHYSKDGKKFCVCVKNRNFMLSLVICSKLFFFRNQI